MQRSHEEMKCSALERRRSEKKKQQKEEEKEGAKGGSKRRKQRRKGKFSLVTLNPLHARPNGPMFRFRSGESEWERTQALSFQRGNGDIRNRNDAPMLFSSTSLGSFFFLRKGRREEKRIYYFVTSVFHVSWTSKWGTSILRIHRLEESKKKKKKRC